MERKQFRRTFYWNFEKRVSIRNISKDKDKAMIAMVLDDGSDNYACVVADKHARVYLVL